MRPFSCPNPPSPTHTGAPTRLHPIASEVYIPAAPRPAARTTRRRGERPVFFLFPPCHPIARGADSSAHRLRLFLSPLAPYESDTPPPHAVYSTHLPALLQWGEVSEKTAALPHGANNPPSPPLFFRSSPPPACCCGRKSPPKPARRAISPHLAPPLARPAGEGRKSSRVSVSQASPAHFYSIWSHLKYFIPQK